MLFHEQFGGNCACDLFPSAEVRFDFKARLWRGDPEKTLSGHGGGARVGQARTIAGVRLYDRPGCGGREVGGGLDKISLSVA
jgi:hypothetical protein